ncbi:MAG: helix-turn-helix transcriptional regulator [Deltaproteobacteria bacterium]|nr:helix-turn-helix transcriptional regulator [Deltaproteobacteria bacterium]
MEKFRGPRTWFPAGEFVFAVVEGKSAVLELGGTRTPVWADHVLLLAPGQAFTLEGGPLQLSTVSVDGKLLRKAGGAVKGFAVPAVEDGVLRKAVLKLHAAVLAGKGVAEQRALLEAVAGRAARHAGAGASSRGTMGKVLVQLEKRSAQGVSLEALARPVGLSVFQLVRAFSREHGITPHALLVQLRVQEARRLLRSGARTHEAAKQAGFADPSHLVRHFKRLMLVTPGAYARAGEPAAQ